MVKINETFKIEGSCRFESQFNVDTLLSLTHTVIISGGVCTFCYTFVFHHKGALNMS